MKKIMLAVLAGAAAMTAVPAAHAAQGCGVGFHRGPYGGCRRNFGPGPAVIAPGIIVGGFYAGRGYWDGHRYWGHRYRYGGGWRYR